jgi:S-adenosylmethionine:tRNA ribosyltransferase-isomerase
VNNSGLSVAQFDFDLPPALIAQTPPPQRGASRLLVLNRAANSAEHRSFADLPEFLRPGDCLVLNNSRVIPARLRAFNPKTGGEFEVLLLEQTGPDSWWTMMRPGKRARAGTRIVFRPPLPSAHSLSATVLEVNAEGHRRLAFESNQPVLDLLDDFGEVPLPPYITRDGTGPTAEDKERYQTVYAQPPGSVAAPTAGLHFTPALLETIRGRGVSVLFVTLHVGLGTFAPVKVENVSDHHMHEERFFLSPETVAEIAQTKARGGRVVAVGTTTVRVLESVAAANHGQLSAGHGSTRIFIYPPCRFHVIDALVTNFHLPRSTLLMLVSAFASPGALHGIDFMQHAYATAVQERYRFFSYGDAMLIL